jgi:hypothetical protein
VNLRLEPSRDAAQLAQLPENLKVQIYGRRVLDRPAPDGQPSAAKVRDAWYLIRADARAGWVLGRFVALDIPEKLAPYAQGANMVAWVVLKTVDDEGQPVPEYLTADRLGTQEADFSHIRVFTWWIKNHKYVTAYVESNLNGYFPIRVARSRVFPTFRLRLMDDQGQKFQKVYGLFDTMTRTVGTVPGWESDAMPASPEVPSPPTFRAAKKLSSPMEKGPRNFAKPRVLPLAYPWVVRAYPAKNPPAASRGHDRGRSGLVRGKSPGRLPARRWSWRRRSSAPSIVCWREVSPAARSPDS